jgi:hypothetical protein
VRGNNVTTTPDAEKGALRGGFHVYRRLVRDMGVEQRVVTLTIVEEVLVMWRDGSVG